MILDTWAARHGIPAAAIAELRALLSVDPSSTPDPNAGRSEAWAQAQERLKASKAGGRLWRNNVGAGKMENGSYLRWGLANDSKGVNERIKSADLIGIQPVLIQQAHVGSTIGQFVSREVKKPGWRYTGRGREPAQLAWAELILALGGNAAFATGN